MRTDTRLQDKIRKLLALAADPAAAPRDRAMVEAFGEDGSGRRGKHNMSHAGYQAGSKAHIPAGRPVSGAGQRLLS